ncbi:MAG: translation initiation factor [Muribaculaceae bacterium]|nr:translation initiation factor [Muribaculaceae bacterium]
MTQDWKDKLASAFNLPTDNTETTEEQAPEQPTLLEQQGKTQLDILLDKHCRKGKKVTLITGFLADDASVAELAATLKKQCGVGGSSRGGEILLQGDFRQKVLELLKGQGFKARII